MILYDMEENGEAEEDENQEEEKEEEGEWDEEENKEDGEDKADDENDIGMRGVLRQSGTTNPYYSVGDELSRWYWDPSLRRARKRQSSQRVRKKRLKDSRLLAAHLIDRGSPG